MLIGPAQLAQNNHIPMERLDKALVSQGLTTTRSQAESYIKLGKVFVNGQVITKSGFIVKPTYSLKINVKTQYVSRAALKLVTAAKTFNLNFKDKTILDVGSSTGGFSDYALQEGATKVIAVDVGTNQLHPTLRNNPKIELHEQTDIREFKTNHKIDLVLIDVSFISVREILPAIARICSNQTQVVLMAKPQFEAPNSTHKNKGIIKNETQRRAILTEVESWVKKLFKLEMKADSQVAGMKGNLERFYLLTPLAPRRSNSWQSH